MTQQYDLASEIARPKSACFLGRIALYLLTASLSIAIGCIWMAVANVWPFGDQYLTAVDNGQGVAPFLNMLKLLGNGVESLYWTFLSGGVTRTAMLASFHVPIHPASWIAYLLPSGSSLQTLSWLLLVQLIFCSLTALFFLRKTFRECPTALHVALALGYTFSHFLFSKYAFLPFLNIAGLFPLFLYSLDALLKRGRFWCYLVISTYMVACAPYFFWMWGLFAILYIASWYGLGFRKTGSMHLVLFASITLAAAALSVFSWLPSVAITMESARTEIKQEGWFYAIKGTYLFNLWMLSPLLLGGLIAFCGNIRKFLSSPYAICMLLLVISCCIIPMNWVWHSGRPVMFPVRFSYMITLMSCCLAAQVFSTPENEIPPSPWKTASIVALIICLFAGICSSTPIAERILWVAATLATAIALAKRQFVISAGVAIPLFCCAFVLNRPKDAPVLEAVPERIIHAEQLGHELPEKQQNPWSRVKSFDLCLSSNFSQTCGLNSFCNFAHTSTAAQQAAAENLGYLKHYTRITDFGGTLFSDSFMGGEFIVAKHPILAPLLERIPSETPLYVYRNPYYWGDGVILSADILDTDKDFVGDPAHNQQQLFETLGGEGKLFEKRTIRFDSKPDLSVVGTYAADETEWIYTESAPICAFFFQLSWYNDYLAVPSDDAEKQSSLLIQLPCLPPNGKIQLTASPRDFEEGRKITSIQNLECNMYKLELQKLMSLAEKHRGKVRVSSIRGRTMEVEVHPDKEHQLVLLPYFFHKGYSAKDEQGRDLPVHPYHGFTAISLSRPETQKISLHYSMPLEREALICSLVSLIIMAGIITACKRLRINTLHHIQPGLVRLLRMGAISAAWVVLLSPFWAKAGQFLFK